MGIFNTSHFPVDYDKTSFSSMITRLMPGGNATLFGLTSYLSSEIAMKTEHGFFTKTMIFPSIKINLAAGYTAADTVFTVDSTDNVLPGTLLRNQRTGEIVIVNSVPSSVEVTVTRGMGSVAAAVINDNDDFYSVGTAFEESSTRPSAGKIIPVRVTNLTQIFRNTWALSGTASAVEVMAGDTPESENRQDCAALHATDIEKALFFSQKYEGIRNGQPFRLMDGLIAVVSNLSYYPPSYSVANIFTAAATTNWTQLEAMIDPTLDQATDPKGANERVIFLGGTAKKVINNIGRLNGTYQLIDGQTNYGLQFKTLTTARGTFRLIEHPLFNSNADWSKMAIVVDLATFKLAYLTGRKTQNKEFNTSGNQAQDNGIDAIGGTLTTELTAVIKNPPANAVIYGLTAAAVG